MSMTNSYYYVDDAMMKQGPFQAPRIKKWFNRGLLPPSLLISTTPSIDESWKTLLSFDELTTGTQTTRRPTKLTPARPIKNAARILRAQILTTQFELALLQLQHDALQVVSESISQENQNYLSNANVQLVWHQQLGKTKEALLTVNSKVLKVHIKKIEHT